jgi:hypothetical protein
MLCAGLAWTVVGCGGGHSEVSPDAAAQLKPRVEEIRALATAREPDQVSTKLAELRQLVASLRSRHALTDQGAQTVLAAADAVSAQLVLITSTTTAPPPTTITLPTSRSDSGKGAGKARGNNGRD